MVYRFGDVRIDTSARELTRRAVSAHLTRKAFELLILLVERRPDVVMKEDIHRHLWPDTFVSESSIQALISEIRHAIDAERTASAIRTVHGVGYAFAADVVTVERPAAMRTRVRAWLLAETWRVPLYDGDNILGRGSDDVAVIEAPSISRRHARVALGDTASIEDLGSKNGTWVRDARVTTPVPLADGDQVRLGTLLFTFRFARGVDSTDTHVIGRPKQ